LSRFTRPFLRLRALQFKPIAIGNGSEA